MTAEIHVAPPEPQRSVVLPLESKATQLARQLQARIFGGSHLPGDRISELDVAGRFGCSQATARQALSMLSAQGLVTRDPSRPTVATNLSYRDVHDRLDTRIPLEALAWEKAVHEISEAAFAELENLTRQLADANRFEIDYEFHRRLWQASGNKALERTLEELVTPMLPVVNAARGKMQNRSERVNSHQQILRILKGQKRERLIDAVEQHVNGAYEFFRPEHQDCRTLMMALRVEAASPVGE